MTSLIGNTFRVTGPLWGVSTCYRWIPSQRQVTWSFVAFFDLHLNKRLNKQSRHRWFETPTRSLCGHYNVRCKLKQNSHDICKNETDKTSKSMRVCWVLQQCQDGVLYELVVLFLSIPHIFGNGQNCRTCPTSGIPMQCAVYQLFVRDKYC